jgi:hypothetical protein
MKRDFHYCCVAVLARAAGFPPAQALTLAYASQYVDDAYESEPIRVGELIFEPVRMAHLGLQAWDWSVQKRIYIPFHFLPRRPLRTPRDSFLTHPVGPFARLLWSRALLERGPRRLLAMGIALHTLADGWAHRGFSGREHPENDVERIEHRVGGRWKRLFLPNLYLDLAPKVGHAQAGSYPDQPGLTWRYRRRRPAGTVARDNGAEFLRAARHIHGLLLEAAPASKRPRLSWAELAPRVRERLADPAESVEERCATWAEAFEDLIPAGLMVYDEHAWKREALRPRRERDIDFRRLERSDYARLRFTPAERFYRTPWVLFHRAALRQRHLVLENLL